jgi:hypothetical protein
MKFLICMECKDTISLPLWDTVDCFRTCRCGKTGGIYFDWHIRESGFGHIDFRYAIVAGPCVGLGVDSNDMSESVADVQEGLESGRAIRAWTMDVHRWDSFKWYPTPDDAVRAWFKLVDLRKLQAAGTRCKKLGRSERLEQQLQFVKTRYENEDKQERMGYPDRYSGRGGLS